VISRRICVHELVRRTGAADVQPAKAHDISEEDIAQPPRAAAGLESLEEVQKLLARLPSRERRVVAMYYLEGRSYEEISTELNIPVNTIGPILSRARKKLRGGEEPPKKPTPRRSNPASKSDD
jgi:RNA polymerase sigma-70 factor (ECF subfamily)